MPSHTVVLAQAVPGAAPAPASTAAAPAAPASGTPAVPGAPATGAPGSPQGGPPPAGGFDFILIMMLVLVVMIVFTSLAGRKQRKARESMIAGLKRNDRVVTNSGIVGTVVELYDTEMVLRVDEQANTRIRFRRAAVDHVVREGQQGAIETKPKPEPAAAR